MTLLSTLTRRLGHTSALMLACSNDLDDRELRTQFDPDFSPIGWHLGHVAWQEELWVLRGFAKRAPLISGYDEVFDSFRPHKAARGHQLPDKQTLLEYRASVRAQVLDVLPELARDENPGLMNGLGLLRFVINHESQHCETLLAIRLAAGLPLDPNAAGLEPWQRTSSRVEGYVACAGGAFEMGSEEDPERWDNEGRAHRREVAPFQLQRYPVTNGDWCEFVNAGGYSDERLWSAAGWAFVRNQQLAAPLYWTRDSDGAVRERDLWGEAPLAPARPVCHVSWFEAQAFARFAGARLPSEAEWEWVAKSASAGSSVLGLAESVWQWTSSAFGPYPGFEAQSYRGYSAPWFDGQHRVARGGASVTLPAIARPTFRNWYLPQMRRPFLGVRLAKDLT